MSDTKIQWSDKTWNPIRGCSRVSKGCEHCYAETYARRFSGEGLPYEGLTRDGKWTGEITVVEEKMEDPPRWRKPRRIFVNSMSDLFHPNVTDETIERIFSVMAKTPWHQFQVLTKRPKRMREFLTEERMKRLNPTDPGWPLANVWLGTSIEDQQSCNVRLLDLLLTPAAVRFVSAEPLLERVRIPLPGVIRAHMIGGRYQTVAERLDWVIVGGESGHGARACDLTWIRGLVRDCRESDVPVFVKQWGSRPTMSGYSRDDDGLNGEHSDTIALRAQTKKGDDPATWPEDIAFREFPLPLQQQTR